MRWIGTLGLLVGTLLLPPTASGADAPRRVARVGFLNPLDRAAPHFEAFRQGLAELGYQEGKNVVIEARFAEGQYDRFPALLSDLLAAKVDVIAVTGAVTARAAMKAVHDVPIVFAVVVDPVADGVVASLERPGGNLTGTTSFDPLQPRKQLELLKEVCPRLERVAILGDAGVSEALMKAAETEARALGLQPFRFRLSAPAPDLEGAFAEMARRNADAVLVLEEPLVGVHAGRIAELAARDRRPTLFAPSRVAAGGLLSYGTSQTASIRRMASYIDRILKGSSPGALPVERVIPYELVVNLATARRLGVTVPPAVVSRANRLIQ